MDIVAQTARALHEAHVAGLVHRDVKPGNLLITPEGKVKITDFGIARVADQVSLTATGQVMGTVQYLAPEQATGKPATPSTDVYSLGIVAYEALKGARPFTGETQMAIAMSQINDAPAPLPEDVPAEIAALVMSCLAKKPGGRPDSALDLADKAEALSGATPRRSTATRVMTAAIPAVAEETTLIQTPTAPTEKPPIIWPWIATIGLMVLVAAGIVVAMLNNKTAPTPTPTPTQTQTESPTPTPTPTATDPNTVTVLSSDIFGMNLDEATTYLQSLGLVVVPQPGLLLPAADPRLKTVYDASPLGTLAIGDEIVITYYDLDPNAPGAGN
jgi:serine/threonine-protein kinase